MKELMIEGYKVIMETMDGQLVARVPELPGCSIVIENEKNATNQIKRAMADYLVTLSELKLSKRKEKPVLPSQAPKTKR